MSFFATIFDHDTLAHEQTDGQQKYTVQRIHVGSHHFDISTEILDLLWFGDGRRKNTMDFEDSSISEPSEIMTRDQVYQENPYQSGIILVSIT